MLLYKTTAMRYEETGYDAIYCNGFTPARLISVLDHRFSLRHINFKCLKRWK